MKTGELGKITSEGGLLLVGKRLEWDALAPDESFFLNYEGIETKFIVTGDPSKTSVALVTTQVLEEGDSAAVWFRTRKGTAMLHQVYLTGGVVCVVPEEEEASGE